MRIQLGIGVIFLIGLILGCSLSGGDEENGEKENLPGNSVSKVFIQGQVDFPENAGIKAEIQSKIRTKVNPGSFQVAINGTLTSLNSEGGFSASVGRDTRDEYRLEVFPLRKTEPVLLSLIQSEPDLTNALPGQSTVNIDSTAKTLAFENYRPGSGLEGVTLEPQLCEKSGDFL